jgi:pseudoazurin
MQKLAHCALLTLAALVVTSGAHAKDHKVKMLDQGPDGYMVFEPGFLKVSPGDTVHFEPTDAGHNSNAVIVPGGAESWQGGIGEKVSVTMKSEGVYIYQCDPHLRRGMVGVIQVGSPVNLDAAQKKASALERKIIRNGGRLNSYMAEVE